MFTCRPTYFNCFNNLNGSGLTAVNLINIPFSIQKGRFLLLNALLNWCRWSTRILWHAESNNIELRCLEEAWNFQRFLYSQSGLHWWLTWRLVKVSCKMPIISIPIFILQPVLSYFPSLFNSISLIHNSWYTELITCRYDKAKNLHELNDHDLERKEPQSCKLVL